MTACNRRVPNRLYDKVVEADNAWYVFYRRRKSADRIVEPTSARWKARLQGRQHGIFSFWTNAGTRASSSFRVCEPDNVQIAAAYFVTSKIVQMRNLLQNTAGNKSPKIQRRLFQIAV
jgi:hypothetical protein